MARLRRSSSIPGPDRLALAIVVAVMLPVAAAGASTGAGAMLASLEDPAPAAPASEAGPDLRLFLEVFIADRPIGLLADVRQRGSRLWATPDEMRSIGLVVPDGVVPDADGLVAFDALPGLSYRYDIPSQRLHLQVPAALRPQQSLGYEPPAAVQVRRDAGWRLGYDAYGRQLRGDGTLALATSFNVFGRWGNLEVTGVSRAGGDDATGFDRLDTRWRWSDPERMWTWTAGDLVSGGLNWSRPVRMGGLQWRRDFGVRPDLVTLPLARFAADATVPSAVELYIDNVRRFGSEVQDGPFVLDALPQISGAGMAQLVVRDALGRETRTSVPLYVDYHRLAPGLSDFSLEVGVLRRGFAGLDDSYGQDLVGSGSWRRGISAALTLEAHAESAPGLRLGGLGAAWSPGNRWGLVRAAWARSAGDSAGHQRTLGYQWNTRHWGLDLQGQWRSTGFRDLGDVGADGLGAPTSLLSDQRATTWARFGSGTVSFSWLRWRDREERRQQIRTLSWSQNVGRVGYLAASVFDDGANRGGGVTFTVALARQRQAALSVQRSGGTQSVVASLRQTAPYEGGWGWAVQAGDRDGAYGLVQADIRGRYGEASFGMDHVGGSTGAFAQASGSIVSMHRQVFFSRRVSDAFAVVSTGGVAGVPILSENRVYGVTNADGYLLLPELRGWQRNRVTIDPDRLPPNYRVGGLEQLVVPTDRGGVLVDFEVSARRPAIVVLLDATGKPVPAGTRVRVQGGADTVAGFDGEVYLESLAEATVLELILRGGRCRYDIAAAGATPDGAPARPGPQACHWSDTP